MLSSAANRCGLRPSHSLQRQPCAAATTSNPTTYDMTGWRAAASEHHSAAAPCSSSWSRYSRRARTILSVLNRDALTSSSTPIPTPPLSPSTSRPLDGVQSPAMPSALNSPAPGPSTSSIAPTMTPVTSAATARTGLGMAVDLEPPLPSTSAALRSPSPSLTPSQAPYIYAALTSNTPSISSRAGAPAAAAPTSTIEVSAGPSSPPGAPNLAGLAQQASPVYTPSPSPGRASAARADGSAARPSSARTVYVTADAPPRVGPSRPPRTGSDGEEEMVEGPSGRAPRTLSLSPMPSNPEGVWTADSPTSVAPPAVGSSDDGSALPKDYEQESLADVEVTSVTPVIDWLKDKNDLITLASAVGIGVAVAASVFVFDVSIQFIHDLPDIFSTSFGIGGGRATGFQLGEVSIPFRCIMPIGAGVAVAWLQSEGFSPPLKVLTRAIEGVVDDRKSYDIPRSYWPVFRKAAASAITLGSGASLGPEAPSVELGANTAAVISPKTLSKRRQRMLVAAGAAAGVTAAFDAPVAGALFAIEFVLKSSRLGLDRLSTSTVFVSTSVAAGVEGFLRTQGQVLGIKGAASHLVGRIPYFSINNNPIFDVLQFSALGLGCAAAAVLLYEGVKVSEAALRPLPRSVSAPLAGAVCGAIALKYPSVQYGYIALEEIFRESTSVTTSSLVGLLLAKIAATSVCVGGGLVGGLFAPSLFLGALVGDIMSHIVGAGGVADTTSYVVVGAAAVLGASCRAPLTAVALMVEITRDTGLLVPLLAAIGMSSLVADYLETSASKEVEKVLMGIYLRSRALFWGATHDEHAAANPAAAEPGPDASNTVASVMTTSTNMYVRHTLPLEQARSAMLDNSTKAAVVVDDNFKVMGVVYLPEVEDEIVRRSEMTAPDSNFNRPS